jgi:integrase
MTLLPSGADITLSGESSLAAALTLYLERVSARKSPIAHAREQRKARQITARLGALVLQEVTALDLSDYRDHRLKSASAAIVQGDLELLRALFEVLEQWGVTLEGNPVNGVSPPRGGGDRPRTLGPGELVRLLAACDRRPTPMLGWIVRIALQTAMSKDEILKIRTPDLDLKERVVTLPKGTTRPARQVPLSLEAVRLFREVLDYPERPAGEALLFFGAMGVTGLRRPLAIDKAFRGVVLQARLKGYRFADLRHEALSRMEAAGLTEVERATVAGLVLPRGVKRPPRPEVGALVARLDERGFGVVGRVSGGRGRSL